MIDRRNRVILVALGVVLLAAGVLALLLGVGVFGQPRSHYSVLTHANVHRWDAYGASAYAVAGAAGFVLLIIGYLLASREWRRNDGKTKAGAMRFPILDGDRGTIPNVSRALVGLFGSAPDIEHAP
jgi:ABC-type Fe3+ transport system permease subunit